MHSCARMEPVNSRGNPNKIKMAVTRHSRCSTGNPFTGCPKNGPRPCTTVRMDLLPQICRLRIGMDAFFTCIPQPRSFPLSEMSLHVQNWDFVHSALVDRPASMAAGPEAPSEGNGTSRGCRRITIDRIACRRSSFWNTRHKSPFHPTESPIEPLTPSIHTGMQNLLALGFQAFTRCASWRAVVVMKVTKPLFPERMLAPRNPIPSGR